LITLQIPRITASPAKGLGAFEPRRRGREGWGEAPRAWPVERGGTPKGRPSVPAGLASGTREEAPPRWREKAFPPGNTYFIEGKTNPSRNLGNLPQSRDGNRICAASPSKSYRFLNLPHHLPRDWGHSSQRRRMRQGWGEAPRALPVERGGNGPSPFRRKSFSLVKHLLHRRQD